MGAKGEPLGVRGDCVGAIWELLVNGEWWLGESY